MDVERVRPAQDANVVAAEQVRSFLRRFYEGETAATSPLFVFDAGYDPVSRCSEGSREAHARDPRPLAGGSALLRRPRSVRPAGAHRTPSSPRTEDEVQ
jgi:hypothetical protein